MVYSRFYIAAIISIILLLPLFLPSFAALAQNEVPENPKMTGILGMPALCYWDCEGYDEPVPLYYVPDDNAVPATYLLYNDIDNWPDFEEYAYEAAGALVYERQDENWYKIKRHDEFFWVRSEENYEYLSYPELLDRRLTFLITRTGVPAIYDRPDITAEGRNITHPAIRENYGEVPVNILDVKEQDGIWWVKVAILEHHVCFDDQETVMTEGWVRAYNGSNQRNFWYYPRGC